MKKSHWIILTLLSLSLSNVMAETLEILSENLVNNAPITLNLAPCSDYSASSNYGTESDGGEINIYAKLYYSYFDLLPCSDSIVEIGPFASGNYTLNYYASKDGETFVLQDSKPIEIEKVSENDPPMGRIVLNGNAVEDQPINIDHYEINDTNGMAEVSFQWYRNGVPIPGAIYNTYILTNDDAYQDLRAVASYIDGLGKEEQFRSLSVGAPSIIANVEDSPNGAIYLSGSFSVGSTLTLHNGYFDGEGMSLNYEWIHTTGKFDPVDRRLHASSEPYTITDYDIGSKIFVVMENLITGRLSTATNLSSEITSARYAPVISLPDNLILPATGVVTPVDPGMATAHDVQDGAITPVLSTISSNGSDPIEVNSNQFDLPSGNHLLLWKASDNNDNTSEAIQLISIEPILEFSSDHSENFDDHYSCPLYLSGEPSKYPVTVPYSLYGVKSSDQSELRLYEGKLVIDGHEQNLGIPLFDSMFGNITLFQSIRLDLGQVTNAVLGPTSSCDILLTSEQISPRVLLNISQYNKLYRIVIKYKSPIIISTTISGTSEENDIDHISYDWSISDSTLVDTDTDTETFTIDPSSVETGLYKIGVLVNLGSRQLSDELSFLLVSNNPARYGDDIDQDGELDYPDGSDDTDQDGIPDYLDHSNLPTNVLQEVKADLVVLIKAEPGLNLFLGDIAFQALNYGALITSDDIAKCINSSICGESDTTNYPYLSGLFDFQIKDLPDIGESVRVVIPQRNSINPNSVFRIRTPTGWQAFLEDTKNFIKTTQGSNRTCPPPRNETYEEGLQEGSWCVELTLEDGGPNDSDGQADGKIIILGGATANTSDSNDNPAEEEGDETIDNDGEGNTDTNTDADSGGGGAIMPIGLLMLVFIQLFFDFKIRQ
ncbi:MAG: hypothetical protein KZQ92_02215 [Candidatus Thiodiazotropha sp. (ex Lucinoma borealis)]|nr:hypothetical protein [Candidatus Thiodiazotropha sp. (ex Lucinoma borealis)]